MPRSRSACRIATIAALCMLAVPFAGTDAGAAPTEACAGGSHGASSFCVTYDASIGPTLNARDPFDADITFSNTSDNHQTERSKWIDTITLHLAASNTSAPGVMASKALPNDLVIAGDDGDCAAPAFTNCDAGHGVFVVKVSGTGIPLVDDDDTGTFGIERVVNVNDAETDPGTTRYRVDLHVCASILPLGDCAIDQAYSETVEAPIPAAGAGGSVDVSLPVYEEGDQTIQTVTGHYEGTLDSGEIHLQGTATRLDDGSDAPGGPFDVFRFAARCGIVGGSGEFTSHGTTPRTVEIAQQSAAIGGCPSAVFAGSIHGSTVAFHAGGSAAHVAGRTVTSWRWVFGDGAHLTRTVATAAHRYPVSPTTPTDYTAQLIVVDSEGAISLPVTSTIHGTATSISTVVKSPNQLRVAGTVAPSVRAGTVKVVLQRKVGSTFHTVGTEQDALNGAGRYAAVFSPRPAVGMCRAAARFPGDSTRLGSSGTKTFSC